MFGLLRKSILGSLMLMAGVSPLSAEGENGEQKDKGLFIVTTTDNISAGLARRLQEGPDSPDDNMSEDVDKQRKTVGLGEGVELKLEGKRKGDDAKVTWSYVGDAAQYVKLPNTPRGNPVKMTVKTSLTSNKSVTIKATNKNGESRQVSFSLKIPAGFKGTHEKVVPYDPSDRRAGVVPVLKDDTGKIINPQPGETGTIGVSATLSVTVLPVDVSFDGFNVLERANDPKGFKPEHKPNIKPMKLEACSRFTDNICGVSSSLPGDPVPTGWTWKCSYIFLEETRELLQITGKDIEQTISFSRTGTVSDPGVETTVTKFKCSVSRDSRTGEHKFTPNTYQP